MSKHERSFRNVCTCGDCDGTGSIWVGRRGANNPDVEARQCPSCDGEGEVCVVTIFEAEDEV